MIGFLVFGLIHFISSRTRLFLGMERALLDGFFYLREYNVHEQNPLVSNQVMIFGFDEESIAVIGKWPWKRYVHAQFLNNIEKFSPRAVMFDIVFVNPEKAPTYVSHKFETKPGLRREVESAFAEMDGLFEQALEKYDNVYLDLQLVEQPRTGLPEFYQDRIRFNEEMIKPYSQPVKNNMSPVVFHSLEPILNDFIQYAHPVAINVLSDDDGVTRSFPLYHTYRMSDQSNRNLFSAVLALTQRYYRVKTNDVIIRPENVLLKSARAPILDPETRQPVVSIEGFEPIAGRIQNPVPPKGYPYNQNLFNFLVNQQLIGVQTEEKIPLFPLHLVQRGNNRLEILDGWEIFDAARRAGSKKIQSVFYKEIDIYIETPLTGYFYINYAGREKQYFPDPETGAPIAVKCIPSESYSAIYAMGEIPDMPELEKSGAIKKGYDKRELEKWYFGYCEEKAFAIFRRAQQTLGEKALDDVSLQKFMSRYPEEGKYFFYYNFFENYDATPGMLEDLIAAYPDFGHHAGQAPEYFFNEKELVLSLMNVYREKFKKCYNRFVFTGGTALGLGDIQQTPYGTMSGINTIVNAFNTIVTQNFLKMSSNIPGLNSIILSGLCLLCIFAYGFSRLRVNITIFVILLTGTFITGFFLFNNHNIYITTAPLVFSNAMIFVSIIIFKMLTERKDKRFLKTTFSNYLAPEVIDELYASKTMPTLGGEARSITAYFTDIQSFSTFSEKLTAHQLVELINEYLTAMTDILMDEGGTLDKYEGDAIIAFFGAPMELPDHSLRACRVALAMQHALVELRSKWKHNKQGPNEPDPNTKKVPSGEWRPGDKWPRIVHEMKMRIGINTGEIVVGNMGSSMRMNYTMMGDPVNLAARLEALGKQYGVYILVSEYALEQEISNDDNGKTKVRDLVEVRFIDNCTVVGKSEPVRVYELLAMRGELPPNEKRLLEIFDMGMSLYLRMEWDEAISLFRESLKLEQANEKVASPSQVYIRRCKSYKEHPPDVVPGETWDGVCQITKK